MKSFSRMMKSFSRTLKTLSRTLKTFPYVEKIFRCVEKWVKKALFLQFSPLLDMLAYCLKLSAVLLNII